MEFFVVYLCSFFIIWAIFVFVSDFLNRNSENESSRPAPSKRIEQIPVVGLRDEWFQVTRASLRQLTHGVTTLLDGYRQFGRPFMTNEASFQEEVLLPPEQIKWFAEQPTGTLSSRTIREERHATKYLHHGLEFDSTVFFLTRVARDSLTRNLGAIQGPMYEEIRLGFDNALATGDGSEWKTVNVYDTMQQVALSTMSRVFFGLPLSNSKEFLTFYSRYILAFGVGTIVVGELPRMLKRLLVPIFNLPLRYYRRRSLNMVIPEVEKELRRRTTEDGGDNFIRQCAKVSKKPAATGSGEDPQLLAESIMMLGFAAMSSTTIQMSNILLDILGCPPGLNVYEKLREEAETVLKEDGDWHNPATFNRLVICDSVIRESLRCHPILIKGLTKEVVPAQGVQLPNGIQVPQGTWLGVPVLGIHRDERFYPDSATFDPYRFSRLKLEREKESKDGTQVSTGDLDAANTSPSYLGFGYGRHACPGRWFAVLMIKTMLAYLTIHYEMEWTGSQNEMKVVGDAALPPISATIRVRRRTRAKV
ncbi:hypothetical protein diail_481 [Diaporthe ilicicola]|nr:hypothetical protein diail_481 [Diaporthe ilicicola]